MDPIASDLARANMIEQQIRPCEVLDDRVLDAMNSIPREEFVAAEYVDLAFTDTHVPLQDGELMMKPIQEGAMLQALNIKPGDKVLHIGTGSGYTAACMAHMGGEVTSYEINPEIAASAQARLSSYGVTVINEDIFNAALHKNHYDVIAVTGSLPEGFDALKDHLNETGRMFTIEGKDPVMHAMLTCRQTDGELRSIQLVDTLIPALHNAPTKATFSF